MFLVVTVEKWGWDWLYWVQYSRNRIFKMKIILGATHDPRFQNSFNKKTFFWSELEAWRRTVDGFALFFLFFSSGVLQKPASFSICRLTSKVASTMCCWALETTKGWSRSAPSRSQCATALARRWPARGEQLLGLASLSSWESWLAFCCCSVSLCFTLF